MRIPSVPVGTEGILLYQSRKYRGKQVKTIIIRFCRKKKKEEKKILFMLQNMLF